MVRQPRPRVLTDTTCAAFLPRQVLTDTGVPVDMAPMERLFWSPIARPVDLDKLHYKRVIKPLTRPRVALGFDFRAGSPPTKREEKFEMELGVTDDGRCNAVVFWCDPRLYSCRHPIP